MADGKEGDSMLLRQKKGIFWAGLAVLVLLLTGGVMLTMYIRARSDESPVYGAIFVQGESAHGL